MISHVKENNTLDFKMRNDFRFIFAKTDFKNRIFLFLRKKYKDCTKK
jgi:hypothetical protein